MLKIVRVVGQVPEVVIFSGFSRFSGWQKTMLQCSIVGALLLICSACGHKSVDSETSNAIRTLRRGLPGEPRTLDPQLADDDFSFQIVRDLYEGLTAEDSAGKIVPGAAESWTSDATGTIYTFHLRANARWSNGAHITASEFVDGLRHAVDPKTASGSAGLLAVIKGATQIIAGSKDPSTLAVTAIDKSSIRIELEYPAPFILQILSQPIAAPVYEGAAARSESHGLSSAGGPYDGAYTLVDRVVGSHIDLARNPDYWNAAKVPIGRIRYVNAESEATELREYLAGDLDLTFSIPLSDLGRLSRSIGDQIKIAPTLGTTYLALNLSKPPLRDALSLREALSIAVDRDEIAAKVIVGVMPAYNFVANGTSDYDPARYEWHAWTRQRQLQLARYLYAKSGYSEKNPLHLKLYFSSGESIQRLMIAIAGSWKQNLGVICELASDEFRVFLVERKNRAQWDVARLKWDADYDDPSSFLDVFLADSPQNDADYLSPLFNQMMRAARMEPRLDRRMHLLQDSEQILMDDYPIIPIYFTRSRRLVKPYVGGAQVTPMNRIYSKNLYWK